jgi:hypothetical protein
MAESCVSGPRDSTKIYIEFHRSLIAVVVVAGGVLERRVLVPLLHIRTRATVTRPPPIHLSRLTKAPAHEDRTPAVARLTGREVPQSQVNHDDSSWLSLSRDPLLQLFLSNVYLLLRTMPVSQPGLGAALRNAALASARHLT